MGEDENTKEERIKKFIQTLINHYQETGDLFLDFSMAVKFDNDTAFPYVDLNTEADIVSDPEVADDFVLLIKTFLESGEFKTNE